MKHFLFIILLLSAGLSAEEVKTEDASESTWKNNIEFGYLMSSGNTETESLNGKINAINTLENWRHDFKLAAFSSSDNDQTTAERFLLEYQGDRKLDNNSYFFVNTSYEEDKFSGYEYRANLTAGYGKQLYNANKMTIDAEIGAGYRQSELTFADPEDWDNNGQNEAIFRLAAKYLWQIEEDRSLAANLTVDAGEESTISTFEIAFVSIIAGDLSLKAAFDARHTSEVPAGIENLDTVTSINLLYSF